MDFKAGAPFLPPLSWGPTPNVNGYPLDLSADQDYARPRRYVDPMPYPAAPVGFQGEGIQALHQSFSYWQWDYKTPPPNSFLTGLLTTGFPASLGNLTTGIGDLPRLFNLKG